VTGHARTRGPATRSGVGLGDPLERVAVADRDHAGPHGDVARAPPVVEALVDALARDPDQAADLLLRQLDVEADPLRRALAERLGEPQQAARDPRGCLEEERVLEVLARLPQALAQDREEPCRDLRVAVRNGRKRPRSSTSRSVSASVTASAVRGRPSRSAISPKTPPRSMMLSTSSLPPAE
jgi:hypothetical protein